MQGVFESCWTSLAQVEFRLVWSIPFVLAICGLFFWTTRRAALRPMAGQVERLARTSDRARESAIALATADRVVAHDLREQLTRLDNAAGEAGELADLARQTAGAAAEVAGLAEASRSTAERSAGALSEVIDAMDQTQAGLQETRGLVATLDEIAVQTNLMALSAAVEISRSSAGACGGLLEQMAETLHEVAIRSAEAARVAELVISRTHKCNRGAERLAAGLRAGLVEMEGSAARIARLSHEVSAAEKDKSTELDILGQVLSTLHGGLDQTAAAAIRAAERGEESGTQSALAATLARQLAGKIGRGHAVESAELLPAPIVAG